MPVISKSLPDYTRIAIDDGRLYLIKKIGSGSYGHVYKALDTTLDKHFAVKVMLRCKMNSPEWGYQQAELRLHSLAARNTNVVQFYRSFEEGKGVFVVLDLCDGDLFHAITETTVFRDVDMVKRVFLQMLDAVEFIHSKQVYHRDIKPENFLADNLNNKTTAQVYLADFGLATTNRTSQKFGVGSSFYISPECLGESLWEGLKGKQFNVYACGPSDIWSLGVVLVNLTTGRCPWAWAKSSDNCFSAYCANPAGFLLTVLPISVECNNLLREMFNLNPMKRAQIPAIRKAIVAMDDFWMPEEQVIPTVHVVAAAPEPQRPRVLAPGESESSSNDSVGTLLIPIRDTATLTPSSGSSSGGDSDGPITPQSAAVNDADIEIVEALDINSEVVGDVVIPEYSAGKKRPMVGKKRSSIFRTALNRITGKVVPV